MSPHRYDESDLDPDDGADWEVVCDIGARVRTNPLDRTDPRDRKDDQ
jgi:hypothetical protein